MGVLKAGPRQAEVIEQMLQRLARDRYGRGPQVGEVRQTEPARFVNLPEDDLLFFAMHCPPGADPPLQCPADARGQFRVAAQHLLKNCDRAKARGRLQKRDSFSVENVLKRVRAPPAPRLGLLRRQLGIL